MLRLRKKKTLYNALRNREQTYFAKKGTTNKEDTSKF